MKNSNLPHEISIAIIKEKHKQVKEIMSKLNIDCWLVFTRETEVNNEPILSYIVGNEVVWDSAFMFFLIKGEFKKIAIIGNFDVATEEGKHIWDQVIGYKEGIGNELREVVKKYKPKQIAIDYSIGDVSSDGLSYGMFLKLQETLKGLVESFESAERITQYLRSVKTETELKLIKKACELTEEINKEMTEKYILLNKSELDIQRDFHNLLDRNEVIESWQRRSCPAVDAGPEKEFGHAGPTEGVTKKGHTLHNDFGIKWRGYSSDLQRMWFFGTKNEVPDELRHAFETVKGAIKRASKAIKPGMKGLEVDKVARDFVISQGYEEFGHGLGHQVGRATHDGGTLLAPPWERYKEPANGLVQKDNVFTLELYVKTKNYGWVSLEEMIKVTDTVCEFIVTPVEDFIYV